MHSRRRFLRLGVAAMSVPACASFDALARGQSGAGRDEHNGVSRGGHEGVRLGVQTYSFREWLGKSADMTDKMIAAMRQLGLNECEMWEPSLWPSDLWPPASGEAYREAVRKWRLGPGLDAIKADAAKFKAAGIQVYAFNYGLNDKCTDEEITCGIDMTHAFGAKIMTVSTTLPMAKRSVPFFEKAGLPLGLHGHSDVRDPNQFATPASFAAGLAMSKLYRINLDIGHFCAAGFDPVEFLKTHHARISNLHVKDRKSHEGDNMPFGQGDTPITAVMQLLKRERYPIPAYVEYEYAGTGTPTEEIEKCLAYVRAALDTTR